MSELCKWLHEELKQLPFIKFPFEINQLPMNGIYFFYEDGETWGHGGYRQRIVRIGTHKDGNFRSRIKEHFLLNESRMNFDANRYAPHERSIFRKNIGRALLNKENDKYLNTWDIDFTTRASREKYGYLRDIQKEKYIESEVTGILRNNFSFRYIQIEGQSKRMGANGLESSLIGTVAHCSLCKPSGNWLGQYSPKKQIKRSGLWLVQHLESPPISSTEKKLIKDTIAGNDFSTFQS